MFPALAPLLLAMMTTGCTVSDDSFGPGDDTGTGPDGTLLPVRCTLDPDPGGELTQVRLAPDGALYGTDVGGALYRYTRAGDDDGCALHGVVVWAPGSLDDITDFELDGQGTVHALVFYDELVRLEADGTIAGRCEVESGHAVAVTAAGDRAWVVPIGTEVLQGYDLGGGTCAALEHVPLPHPIGTAPMAAGVLLAVDSHDVSGTLAPGYLLDPETGTIEADLGTEIGPDGVPELAAIADIAPTGAGFWVADSPGGGLWYLDEGGTAREYRDASDWLPVQGDPEPALAIYSVAFQPGLPAYISAGFISEYGVWTVELAP